MCRLLTRRKVPKHMQWNSERQQPAVMQSSFGDPARVRITWNPDDNRFYVEELIDYPEHRCREWETTHTFAGNVKGWHNALNRARTLANESSRIT